MYGINHLKRLGDHTTNAPLKIGFDRVFFFYQDTTGSGSCRIPACATTGKP